jgi:hypothetical protein
MASDPLGAIVSANPMLSGFRDDITTAQNMWKGDYYAAGQMTGDKTVTGAAMLLPLGAGRLFRGLAALRAGSAVDDVADAARIADSDPFGGTGACSFTAATAVATTGGTTAIAAIKIGDTVMAYDPKTGETGPHTVSAVVAHTDPVVEHLATDTGSTDTTPNHPFFTTDRGWVLAGSLQVGEQVRTETGGSATILGFTTTAAPTTMWDLTVDGAHSFFVGQGAVLVHNCPPGGIRGPRNYPSNPTPGVQPTQLMGQMSPETLQGVSDLAQTAQDVSPWKSIEGIRLTPTGGGTTPTWVKVGAIGVGVGAGAAGACYMQLFGECDP